ncbi:hypothetical protein OHA72_39690 [Dactylosporangium sp. NBC_01737]|uniref:hypothetical protein n=1 Tax=Dactylosporangium sp. NBC_01737 TaxID=2975959 RepID=UPI002E11F272|nr:hypothetical protein OHA72_39690 [Dactylosporangium sp. NBC_01737]
MRLADVTGEVAQGAEGEPGPGGHRGRHAVAARVRQELPQQRGALDDGAPPVPEPQQRRRDALPGLVVAVVAGGAERGTDVVALPGQPGTPVSGAAGDHRPVGLLDQLHRPPQVRAARGVAFRVVLLPCGELPDGLQQPVTVPGLAHDQGAVH